MTSIEQFVELPSEMQQEVLDFIDYIRMRRGINSSNTGIDQPHWLVKVNRGPGNGEKVSESVIKARRREMVIFIDTSSLAKRYIEESGQY